jgi:CheY-like chemotaxis protein
MQSLAAPLNRSPSPPPPEATPRSSPPDAVGSFVVGACGDEEGVYADLTGVRVLVVDDEVDARELFAMVLESCGAVVTTASRASEAFSMIRNAPPQVLVSDIGMPDEDGFSLIRRVRALSAAEGGTTPAIAVTAFTGVEHRARALEAGFNQHVGKPFEPQQLVAIVRRLAS